MVPSTSWGKEKSQPARLPSHRPSERVAAAKDFRVLLLPKKGRDYQVPSFSFSIISHSHANFLCKILNGFDAL
jgi:hypothetical protein